MTETKKEPNRNSGVKNVRTEMKNSLEDLISDWTCQRKQSANLKTGQMKLSYLWNRNEREENEQSLRDLWEANKHTNICIMGVPEGEESKEVMEINCHLS